MTEPPDGATPVHAVEQVVVPEGGRASITFTPEQSGTTFWLPIIAIGKRGGTTYEVVADGVTRYAQAALPPTDVDDLSQCFMPPLEFQTKLELIIRNTATKPQTYGMQVVGWEK